MMSESDNRIHLATAVEDELFDYCQREIIGRYGLESNNDSQISDYQFFLAVCLNERVNEGMIRYLLEYFPDAAGATHENGSSPLHGACFNKRATLSIIQLIIAVRSVTNKGWTPLHVLCNDSDCLKPLHMLCDDSERDEAAKTNATQILKLLIKKYPEAVRHADNDGNLPIQLACLFKSPEFCQVLIDADPESVRSVNNEGWTPVHALCDHRGENEVMARAVLKLLIKKYPEAVRCADNYGELPIHFASRWRSPEFCQVLIDAYPGSERIPGAHDVLPLHYACANGSLATVKYVYHLYPDAINHATHGGYPIHAAIAGSSNPAAIGIIQFLLNCDPNQKLLQFQGGSLLHFACAMENVDSSIEVGTDIIEIIFDANPEAIEGNRIGKDIQHFSQQVQTFINRELVYARKAKDHSLMTTPEDNGQLPLHMALQNNVRLGSIKLLVQGNPHAVQSPDNSGALPLHIACQHHDSTDIIDYLVELDKATLDAVDRDGNTALHYACRAAKYETITLLLEKYDAVSVSKRNAQKKLPIELLWESNAVEDKESVEYIQSIFQLLKTYPETVMNNNDDGITQQAELGVCPENEKKRKWGEV
jgi:ankyrin repeat protein